MIAHRVCFFALMCFVPTATLAGEVMEMHHEVYYKNKQRVSKALTKTIPNSTAWIYRSRHNGWKDRQHYNKKRDNVLVLPDTATKDLTLIVWLHGLGGFSEKTFLRVYKQIHEISSRHYSVAIAIPEMPWSINTKTKRARQGRIWRKTGAFEGYVEDTVEILRWHYLIHRGEGLRDVGIVVVGHSAGGSAIASASTEGSICKLNIVSVLWSDATYGGWLSRSHRGCLGSRSADTIVLVRRWDKPHHRASRFLKSLKTHSYDFRVLSRRKYRHSRIGNEALLLSELFPIGC